MIIGKIGKNEKKIKFHLNITCTKCGKTVPGGMKTSENNFGSDSFKFEGLLREKCVILNFFLIQVKH
jgi:hypothetical protein